MGDQSRLDFTSVKHWLVTGTNTGKGADGSEPTGRAIAVKGASIIQVEGDKAARDDRGKLPRVPLHTRQELLH